MHRVDGTEPDKTELRRQLRALRRSLPDRAARSARIWDRVEASEPYRRARSVLAYTSVAGEPDTSAFIDRAERSGRRVIVPEDLCLGCAVGAEPCGEHEGTRARETAAQLDALDVVLVPGLAFTPAGERLGQGGGWYDRVIARLDARPGAGRADLIGVCFAVQLIDRLPIESHDRRVDVVVTEAGVVAPSGER